MSDAPRYRETIKTSQLAHQRQSYLANRDRKYFAYFWEMGLGKSKEIIDEAAYLFSRGEISQLLVVAPNSVYLNWVREEIPKHMGVPYQVIPYPKSNDGRALAACAIWLDASRDRDKLRVLAMSYDSLITDHGFKFAQLAVRVFKTMFVADESSLIKDPTTQRTKNSWDVADASAYRRVCTGTPTSESPFGLYSQFRFLHRDFWPSYSIGTYSAFKKKFGVLAKRRNDAERIFAKTSRYRSLSRLKEMVEPYMSRLLKEDSGVELPPKTYVTRSFELTQEQRRVYEDLRREFVAELGDGEYVEAKAAIVRLMRLQQVTAGFVRAAENFEETFQEDPRYVTVDVVSPDENPKLALLREILDERSGKVIVWCRFTREVETICASVPECVRYDGSVRSADRQVALDRFRDPRDLGARILVANLRAISMGVTLVVAQTMVYYSNSYSLGDRLQSEDRFHRVGQESPVLIVDLVGEDTVDSRVVSALKRKFDVAAESVGDKIRDWIRA